MNRDWVLTLLGDVLTKVERIEDVQPTKEYNLLGVRLDGQGPFLRETKLGSEISANRLFKVSAGDFIYSRLFAWRGAFGVVPPELDGCYVSNEFPVFVANPEKIDIEFLRLWFRLPKVLKRVEADCTGSTPLTRNRFKENFFFALEIALPSIGEQRRIVARIEELAAKVEEAKKLRNRENQDIEKISSEFAKNLFKGISKKGLKYLTIEEACDAIIDYRGRTPPISDVGIPHLTSSNIKNGCIDWKNTKFVTKETYDTYMTRGIPKQGDVIFTMEAPLGEAAVVPDNRAFSLAQRTILLRGRQGLIEGDYLARVLMSPVIRESIYANATGTTVKGIASKRLKQIVLPVPSIDEQKRIVDTLANFEKKMETFKSVQAQIQVEMDALLPSILDKAFKGELL